MIQKKLTKTLKRCNSTGSLHPKPRFWLFESNAISNVITTCLTWLFSLSPLPSHFLLWQLSGGCELTVVLQDFTAGHSSELSIQVGQTVELLERPSERPGWCLVRTTERSPPQEGLVPSSALCISHSRSSVEMDCFFPSGKGRQDGNTVASSWH